MSLLGKSWHHFLPPDDDEDPSASPLASSSSSPLSSSGTTTPFLHRSPSISPRHSPLPRGEDVMKLPRRDMKIFGQCPVQDDFVLVVCDACGRSVKIEAFEQHFRLRHERSAIGTNSSKIRVSRQVNRAGSVALRQCTVELTKEDFSATSSSSSSVSSTPSNSRASSVATSIHLFKPSPSPVSVKEELMEVDDPLKIKTYVSLPPLLKVEEADEADSSSTSNNVISIPDTDPLPHDMSNDLMAMVSGELSSSSLKEEMEIDAADSTNSIQINSPVIKLHLNSVSSIHGPKFPQAPIQHIITETCKKLSPSKKSVPGRNDRKPQREYHPDRHCGVWDAEGKRHCTRALTCKSHSVLLKRKITGRSKAFDELVAEHKASKEAMAVAAAAVTAQRQMGLMPAPPIPPPQALQQSTVPINVEDVLNSITEPNPIEPLSRYQQHPAANGMRQKMGSQGWSPVSSLIGISSTPKLMGSYKTAQYNGSSKRLILSREPDENLHYTSDHPKPLAVCTFGGKRLGGLLVMDRSQFITRKFVRVAITAGGLRVKNRIGAGPRYHPLHQSSPTSLKRINASPATLGGSNYLVNVNYSMSPAAHVSPQPCLAGGVPTNRLIGGVPVNRLVVPNRMGGVSLSPLATAATASAGGISHLTVSETTFKTDIQDFKGGIKFELGRKIKHILPSEISK